MVPHRNIRLFLPFAWGFFFFLLPSSAAVAREGGPLLRSLQEDDSSWSDAFKDFFTDDRCLRVEKDAGNLVDLSNWMSKAAEEEERFGSARLADLTLPGTHNSASYDLTTELNKNDPDYATVEQGTFSVPETVVSSWVCGYALTQSLSVSEQLQAGARYLDLRFDFDAAKSEWRAFHFLWGLDMLDVLDQIATFAGAHPKEVIVLQFGEIYNPDVTAEQRDDYASKIGNIFAGKLVPDSTDLATVTIGELQQAGTTILAVVNDDEIAALADTLLDDQSTIEDGFPVTDSADVLKSYAEGRLEEFDARPADETDLFKLQWIMTPSVKYIQENPLVGNLYSLAKGANDRLPEIKPPPSDPNQKLGNILIVDFVEASPLLEVLDLKQYSDGSFVEEDVPEQNAFSAAAKIGLGVGVAMFICGLCCLCKWCKSKKGD